MNPSGTGLMVKGDVILTGSQEEGPKTNMDGQCESCFRGGAIILKEIQRQKKLE